MSCTLFSNPFGQCPILSVHAITGHARLSSLALVDVLSCLSLPRGGVRPLPSVHNPHSRSHPSSAQLHSFLLPSKFLVIMSATPATTSASASSESRFQAIFQAALKSYQKQTKKDLLTHPLASQLQSCGSTTDILAILQDRVREFEKNSKGDERLTKWLGPTVNVLSAFSAAVSGGVSLVSLAS
jgi:hypothetical protein